MDNTFSSYKNLLSSYVERLKDYLNNVSFDSFRNDSVLIESCSYLLLRISELAGFLPIDVNYIEQRKVETQIKQIKNTINKNFDNKDYKEIYRYATELIPLYSNFLD